MDTPQMWSQDEIELVKKEMRANFHPEEYEVYQNDPVAMDPEYLYVNTDWDPEGVGIEKISPTAFCLWTTGQRNENTNGKPLLEVMKELVQSYLAERKVLEEQAEKNAKEP